MDILETFGLLVEVNVAIAGFAGIISAFRFQERSRIRRGPVAALSVVIQMALTVALFASLPMILDALSLEEEYIWLICSFVAIPFGLALMYTNFQKLRGALRQGKGRGVHAVVQSLSALIILGNILNVVGIGFQREPAPYLLTGVLMSGIAGWMFYRLMLNPLWKSVREFEAAEGSETNRQ